MIKSEDFNGLSSDMLNKFRSAFESNEKNLLALHACVKHDPLQICTQRSVLETANQTFTHKVESEGKPVTNQKNSGRCWIFAALNAMRIPFMKQYKLEDFEFSQSFIFFWDKVERCNFYLHTVIKVFLRKEVPSGRLMSFLLHDPIADGGQWDMVVNIITKYGVMPKKCFPETFCCETSSRMNSILKCKLREYTKDLFTMVTEGVADDKIEQKITDCMKQLYHIIAICLSIPPDTFVWEYYDKEKNYHSVGPITPLKFYEDYVKPLYNVGNKICLVHDPRPANPFGKTYTVDCLGNMVEGRKTIYINEDVKKLLQYAAKSIKNNEPVWFGCDCGKMLLRKGGILDLNIYNYSLLFGTDVHVSMTKAERLIFGESLMTHAMVLTAVSLNEVGEPVKWRVENSWGEEEGEKGYLLMTNEWFNEFGYEIVVDKQYVPTELLRVLETEPIILPAWDPMGSLA